VVDVFISYSRTDHAKVAMLARAVEDEGYEVWWDADLPPHQSYGDVITAKIGQAKAAIVVWSAEAVQSEWVRAEADMARNQKKLVQTALDKVMPPLPFNQIQFAEIGDWQGEPDHRGWRKVKASLAELCGTGSAPAAPRPQVAAPASPQTARAAPAASKAPLLAGIAIAAVGIAIAAGFVLGQRGKDAPAPAPTTTVTAVAEAGAVGAGTGEAGTGGAGAAPIEEPLPGISVELLPQSSSRALTSADIADFGRMKLRLARNEIFARNGRTFRSPDLDAYFRRFSWYRPRGYEVTLTPLEQANVAFLTRAEAAAGR
jgi:hypothetical protein